MEQVLLGENVIAKSSTGINTREFSIPYINSSSTHASISINLTNSYSVEVLSIKVYYK